MQNKAVRLIYYRDRYTPTKSILKETNQLSINQMIAFQILVQTYKIKVSHKPDYHFQRLFSNEQNSRLRSMNQVRVDFKLNIGRSSYFYQASRLWTKLPSDLKESKSQIDFKKRCRKWTLENIPIKP